MKNLTTLFFAFCVSALFSSVACADTKAESCPNIIFIFSDDHSPQAIGAYKGWLASLNPTPNIDKLASQGMLFKKSFCTNSICGPSRAVILTSKHSHKNGFMKNGDVFDGDQATFPKQLGEVGYQTALFGKWHLGSMPKGFDTWEIFPGQGTYYNPKFITPDGTHRKQGHCTELVTKRALEWLDNAKESTKPFLLMCQHKAPHRNWMPSSKNLDLYKDITIPYPDTLFDDWKDNASPARKQEMTIRKDLHPYYDLFFGANSANAAENSSKSKDKTGIGNLADMSQTQRKRWDEAFEEENAHFTKDHPTGRERDRIKYQRYMKNYLRCIRGVDDSVGLIMGYLKENDLEENTIVVYSSDQGFYLGEHGWFDKRWMYDESFSMPLIIKWPGVTQPNSICEEFVQNLDYAATFIDAAGADAIVGMQGESLKPLLEGKATANSRDSIYYHYYASNTIHEVARHNGIRTQEHKLIHFYETGEWELYDLTNDPDELTNLYLEESMSQLVSDLKAKLRELETQYDDATASSFVSN